MNKSRLEAFSDGVIAIIITIMVLELKLPNGSDFSSLRPLVPVFISYILSFVFIGIYWSNHHHLIQTVSKVTGSILWANLHLLFWLSLIPFCTKWMGVNGFTSTPVALYGIVLICAALSYFILVEILIYHHGKDSVLAKAVGKGKKEILSIAIYALGIFFSFNSSILAYSLYAVVAIMWLIPDRRIEKILSK